MLLPMHTSLTDVIDGQGGSALLIKVLNNMGVCLSSDTVQVYQLHQQQLVSAV